MPFFRFPTTKERKLTPGIDQNLATHSAPVTYETPPFSVQKTAFQRVKGGIPPYRLPQDANRAATLVKLAKKL